MRLRGIVAGPALNGVLIDQEGKTSFVTGGDVSRFRRSTLPPAAGSTGGSAGAAPAAPVYRGPVIRIRRGGDVTEQPIGAGAGVAV